VSIGSTTGASVTWERIAGVAFAVLIVVAAWRLPVIQDEAYYWTWAQSLAPRYYDHPPGVALVLAASTAVFGDNWFGLRLPSLLSMVVVGVCCAAGARRLVPTSDRRTADGLVLVLLLGAPMFVIGFIPGTHDPIHGALTAIASYLAIRALDEQRPASDHPRAASDHPRAASDDSRAASGHPPSASEDSGFASGHPPSASDHSLAAPDDSGFASGHLRSTAEDPRSASGERRSSSGDGRLTLGDRRFAFAATFVLVLAGGVKHYAAFVAIGALLGASFSTEGRRLLVSPAPWLGALAGLGVLSPWLIAELGTNGGSLAFQADRVVFGRASRGVVAIPMTLGSLLGTMGPLTALVLLATFLWPKRSPASWVLIGGASLLLIACVVAVWLGSGEANWAMPALIFALPVVVAEAARRRRLRLAMQVTAVFSMVLMAVALAHIAEPFLPASARRDPTARGAGFEGLALRAATIAEAHGAATIATRRYQAASLLRFHLRDRYEVLEVGGRGRKSQYDVWPRKWPCNGAHFVEVAPGRSRLFDVPALGESVVFPRGRSGDPIDTFTITPAAAPSEGCVR